ncbi:MAG: murein DD-endopeptidase MepM/ murein hydrolase activator NlpD [Rickettsiales bacterium]
MAYRKAQSAAKKTKRAKYPKAIKVVNKNNRFSWPIRGTIISKFGPKAGGLYNDGINIKAQSGSNIKSTEDGVVAYVGDELRGYGNLIIVKHAGGWISAYGHLSSTKVKRGQNVQKGQIIAKAGSTGNVKSSQLYFGLRKGREAVNPQKHL